MESSISKFGEVLIYGLININLIIVMLLIFLIVRNAVKLIFERRRGILGSKLRTKLVVAFVSLSLMPTIVLFLVSTKFLSYSIDNWFDMKMGNSLNSSLEVAQDYYQYFADNSRHYAKQLAAEITDNKLYEKEKLHFLKTFLRRQQASLGLGSIEVFFDNRDEKLFIEDPDNPDISPSKLSPKVLEDIFKGKDMSVVQSTGVGDLVSGIAPLRSDFNPNEVIGVVAVNHYIDKDIITNISIISKTYEEYKQLRLFKGPIKFSYIITLFIVTLLIIFSATWFGLFLAKGITVPIQDLAEATNEITNGNLDYHIDVLAEDEIGMLADSFNRMTENLRISNEDLKHANIDLEQRGKYIETVLRNVSAGVVSIDGHNIITTINNAAEKMLNIDAKNILGKNYRDVLRPGQMALVDDLLRELEARGTDFIESQIQATVEGRLLTILVAMTILREDNGDYMGMVVVFEDLTKLKRAERVAAWRDIARRIAHEIKNPLTPVRLSAERLQRKYGDKMEDGNGSVFRECTGTIIDQVDVLKNLVNEFSSFARMPVTNPVPNDLNSVIGDSVIFFKDAHKNIGFDFRKAANLPLVNIDAEQIKRVMVNILDNAVAAVSSVEEEGKIEVSILYDATLKKVKVEVADNGSGVSPADKARLFEPYFSTKKTGTGLGLAIVDSIISDHNGSINVRDNKPKGTIMSFELPVA
jgi:two-component system nitrogen regulation sensor histidine kinase NtrY